MSTPIEEYEWTTTDNKVFKHRREIAKGAFGEVHEVETSHQ